MTNKPIVRDITQVDEKALQRILPDPTWWPFSDYADELEKKADKLLKKVAFQGVFEVQRSVLELMQTNLVILNLFLEAKFKGYKYLTKGRRKRMYRNTWIIADDFLVYANKVEIDDGALERMFEKIGVEKFSRKKNETAEDWAKIKWLALIMSFLNPVGQFDENGNKKKAIYQYLGGASFGKLLADIDHEQTMVGDCNQIVTFYAFLYSLRYPINDLQIKLPKGHVCLHYKGVDIEATNGSFASYEQYEHLLPIVELISTNLMDVSDFRDKQLKVSPREFLKGTQLAYNLSSQRELVTENLKISYQNVAAEAMEQNDFETAIFFLEKAEIKELLNSTYARAVVYYLKNNNYSKALFYADKSGDEELKKYAQEKEGFYYFDKGNWDQARARFMTVGNNEMVKACYAKEFNQIQAKVAGDRDLASMRNHRFEYDKMKDLAYKIGDQALIEDIQKVIDQL